MLKQSIEEQTKSPILLYGRYVDFGSYRDITPHFTPRGDKKYELVFCLDEDVFELINRRQRGRYGRRPILEKPFPITYSLKFDDNEREQIQITEIKCSLFGKEIVVKLDRKKNLVSSVSIDETTYFKVEENLRFEDNGEFFMLIFKERRSTEYRQFDRLHDLLYRRIVTLLSKYCRKGTDGGAIWGIVANIQLSADLEVTLRRLKAVKTLKSWNANVQRWSADFPELKELNDLLFLLDFFDLYGASISQYLYNTFSGIKYLAPLRATAERYYRIQHLAVDEVDPNGKNLPIFLDSLSDLQMTHFGNWTFENFQFKTKISKIEGHYSIKIIQEDDYEINLSDMGFGYSQILPILTQIWYSAFRMEPRRGIQAYNRNPRIIIVIEQPELHLHPEFQARFADMIARVIADARRKEVKMSLVIETHSDIIVNRLGDRILEQDVPAEDINIVIFNKQTESSPTTVATAKYDNEGNLLNWPLGFFLPQS